MGWDGRERPQAVPGWTSGRICPLKGQAGMGRGCPGVGGVAMLGMFEKRVDVALGDTG